MPILTIHSYDMPEDAIARKRFELDLRLELAICALDGKLDFFNGRQLNHNTWCREWYTQEAVDEFYQYFQTLFSKYGGKLHYVKIKNITGE